MTWGKASRKNPLMRRVTSTRGRPSSASGTTSRPFTRWLSLVPAGPDAEQGQRLGDVVARRAHGGRPPQHEARRCVGYGARLGEVALHEPVGQRPAHLPRQPATGSPWGRPSRSCGRSAARWRAPRLGAPLGPAGTCAAGQTRRGGCRPRRSCARRAGTSVVATQRQRRVGAGSARQPAAASASTRPRHAASTRSTSARPAGSRSTPRRSATVARSDGTAPCGSRVTARTVSTRASPCGRLAEHVQPAADLGVLQRAEVAVDVAARTSSKAPLVGSPVAELEVAVDLGVDEQLPHLVPQRRGLGRVHGLDLGVGRRGAARGGRGRRRCRPGSAAGAGGRRRRRGPAAWPASPRRGR